MRASSPLGRTEILNVEKSCMILAVDDDPLCLDEYRDTISNLGYTVACAANAQEALKIIAETPDIGVVITDLDMPTMDGISLLSEISNRFSASRPIVSLFVTAHSSLQVATQAMQYHATDLLTKPVSLENLAAALRRASAKHVTMSNRFEITARTKRLAPSVGRDLVPKCDAAPTGSELQSVIKMLLKFQHYKFKFFDPAVLSGPSWEILLDITEASLRGEAIPASAASATALVPLSTALRQVLIIVSQKDTLNFRSGFICQRQEHPTLINGVIVTLNNIAFSQYSDVPQRSRYRRKRGMAGA